MKNQYIKPLWVAAFCCILGQPAMAEEETITDAIKNGTASLNFRLRTESLDVDSPGVDRVDWTTLRSRLTYKTEAFQGFSGLIEMDDVSYLENFDNGGTFGGDPEQTDLNQGYIAYTQGISTLTFGRQRINLDNQRFVGGVAWRQNEQTYDGFSYKAKLEQAEFFASYIYNVNRIFDDDLPIGDHENETFLLHGSFSNFPGGKLSTYAYFIDNKDAVNFSNDTFGVRYTGDTGPLSYELEFATQSDGGDSTLDYEAEYVLIKLGYKAGAVKLSAGYELLGADGDDGVFITPLATLHKFQGWADLFLGGGTGNLPGGIEELYFSATTKWSGVNFSLIYQDFGSDDSDAAGGIDDYGSEIGFQVAKKFGAYGLAFKYADYNADDLGADTQRAWLTVSASF